MCQSDWHTLQFCTVSPSAKACNSVHLYLRSLAWPEYALMTQTNSSRKHKVLLIKQLRSFYRQKDTFYRQRTKRCFFFFIGTSPVCVIHLNETLVAGLRNFSPQSTRLTEHTATWLCWSEMCWQGHVRTSWWPRRCLHHLIEVATDILSCQEVQDGVKATVSTC